MSTPAPTMADLDQESWDQFLNAIQLNRLLQYAEDFGADAARDILVATGLIPDDSPTRGTAVWPPSPPKRGRVGKKKARPEAGR